MSKNRFQAASTKLEVVRSTPRTGGRVKIYIVQTRVEAKRKLFDWL